MTPIWLLASLLMGCSGLTAEDVVKNLSSANPAVREDTAKIARNVEGDLVTKALLQALHDPVEKVRRNAIESLVELEATDAVPALMSALQTDSSDLVKKDLVDALGQLKDPQAVPVLMAHIESRLNNNGRVPLNAVWALGFLADPRSLELLATLRESSDPYVAWNANQALRQLRP